MGASYSLMQLIIGQESLFPCFNAEIRTGCSFMFVGTRVRLNSFTRGEVINGIVFGVLLYAI